MDDEALEALHAGAFGSTHRRRRWMEQLRAHSLGWATAHRAQRLIGFVNVAWDGHDHAVILDTAVAPEERGAGVGTELVARAVEAARGAGCRWVHVDFEEPLGRFYVGRCGFTPSAAAVLRLGED